MLDNGFPGTFIVEVGWKYICNFIINTYHFIFGTSRELL